MVDLGNGQIKARERGEGGDRGGEGREGRGDDLTVFLPVVIREYSK